MHGRIAIERGRIARILSEEGPSDSRPPDGAIIAPGLIDVHTNGADEFLFNRDQGHAVEVASRAYARQGATGFVAGIITAPWESMLHAASEVSEAAVELVEKGDPIGARCLGIHFEGPFLNPKFPSRPSGRMDPRGDERARAGDDRGLPGRAGDGDDGARDGRRRRVGALLPRPGDRLLGRTHAARYREGVLAIGLGFRTVTHAFNAMPPLDHRDPSILAAFIQESRTTVQLICDGYHVSPPMVDLLYRTLHERVVLATDKHAAGGKRVPDRRRRRALRRRHDRRQRAADGSGGAQPDDVCRHPV